MRIVAFVVVSLDGGRGLARHDRRPRLLLAVPSLKMICNNTSLFTSHLPHLKSSQWELGWCRERGRNSCEGVQRVNERKHQLSSVEFSPK